jgi:hypothetical protein
MIARCRSAVNLLFTYGFLNGTQMEEGHKFFGAVTRRCQGCGEWLSYAARPDQLFCGSPCKVRAWRKANGVNGHNRKGA